MVLIKEKTKCTGCTACLNICPADAIKMVNDNNGFAYPVADEAKCVNCNLCDSACPIINDTKVENDFAPICKIAWNNDNNVRFLSTSGGIFSSLADYVIEKNGFVVGAELTENNEVKHSVVSNSQSLNNLRKAKYVQSNLENVFKEIKLLLDSKNKVLFSGTPCQNAGLQNYLKKKYENLITVEVICHGVASQYVFSAYLDSLEKHYNSKVKSVEFRNKDMGWQKYTNKVTMTDGSTYQRERNEDEYMLGYLKHSLFLRPSCTDCKFKGFPRIADITLGDFWGIEKIMSDIDDRGVSAVIINSKKGLSIFNMITENIYQYDVCLNDILSGNSSLNESVKLGKYSEYFYKKIKKDNFIDLIRKIDKKALWDRADLTLRDRLYIIKENIKKGG